MVKIKYCLQKFLGRFLGSPIIPAGRTVGFSLVRSERAGSHISAQSRVYAPFNLHNVSLGDYSYIARNSNVSNTEIGRFCSIGPNFCCGLGLHPTNGVSTSPMFYSTMRQNGTTLCEKNKVEEFKHTKIGNDVFIGANVTVLDGVTISDGAVIGAGAVVVSDIPPYAVAVGVPAKVVKYRFDQSTIDKLLEKKWWEGDANQLRTVERNFGDIEAFLKD